MSRWLCCVVIASFVVACDGSFDELGVESYADTIPCKPGTTPVNGECIAPAFVDLYKDIIMTKCKGCHVQKAMGGLSLIDIGTGYQNLIDQNGTANGPCKGTVRIKPGAPADSMFFTKLRDPVPCGQKMPLKLSALPQAQLDRVSAWIEDGAAMCPKEKTACGSSCCNDTQLCENDACVAKP